MIVVLGIAFSKLLNFLLNQVMHGLRYILFSTLVFELYSQVGLDKVSLRRLRLKFALGKLGKAQALQFLTTAGASLYSLAIVVIATVGTSQTNHK